MRGRTIAIGDVHGCAPALVSVLKALAPTPADTIVTLGDYIDRGPNSRGVIEQLLALDKQCSLIPLLGNHELMLLDALENGPEGSGWLRYGGKEMLASYDWELANIPRSHLDFFLGLRRFHESDTHLFLHANYVADIPLAEQPDYILFWEHLMPPYPPRHESGKTAIVGHTAQRSGQILDLGHVLCIDTYCHGSGWLTALEVDTREVWQANKLGTMKS